MGEREVFEAYVVFDLPCDWAEIVNAMHVELAKICEPDFELEAVMLERAADPTLVAARGRAMGVARAAK